MENTGGRRNRRACRGYLYDRFDVYQGTRERMRGTRQQSGYQPYKRGLNSKLHLAVDEYGIPASGTVADCSQALFPMEGLETEAFLADKAYDTNELLDMLKEADITAVIPPVKSRKEQRAYSHELYRARHIIENVFRALKR